ncbi:MAG: hypothetical protein GC189_12100 [Alphaproteobacteria bacterium]|nr:hypothetical protein [Alphaproteobacteria bacterium]
MNDDAAPAAVDPAAALRGEAQFALACGAMLLAAGFVLSCGLAVQALFTPDSGWPIAAVALGGPPILLGWAAWAYAAFRLDQAQALERGEVRAERSSPTQIVRSGVRLLGSSSRRMVGFFKR